MAYKLAVFEILRDFFYISIYYASTLSLHIESTDSMIFLLAHTYTQTHRQEGIALPLLCMSTRGNYM